VPFARCKQQLARGAGRDPAIAGGPERLAERLRHRLFSLEAVVERGDREHPDAVDPEIGESRMDPDRIERLGLLGRRETDRRREADRGDDNRDVRAVDEQSIPVTHAPLPSVVTGRRLGPSPAVSGQVESPA